MEYNWNVVQMDRQVADGFVTTVHYTVSAIDGDYAASTYGTVGYTEEGSFTPFDQLTKETVVGWVQESLGKDTVESSLADQINAQKNPTSVSGLPWVTATEE
jgi:hypothetical protein